MAAKVPGTTWDPLGTQTESRMKSHDIVCVHTMAGYFETVDRMFHDNGYSGTESHLGMRADGFTKQWQDLDYEADANYDGNHRCISIETEDHGPEFPPWANSSDVPPWTDKQIDKLVSIITWLCDEYDIPKQLVPDSKPGRRGIAYHRQGIDPWRVSGGELWSGSEGKVCCGDKRIKQLKEIVIPRVQGQQGGSFLADLTDQQQQDVWKDISSSNQGGRLQETLIAVRDINDGDFVNSGKPARANFKTLFIGAMGTGLKPVPEGETGEPGQGDLIEPFKRIMREVIEEIASEDDTPDAPLRS